MKPLLLSVCFLLLGSSVLKAQYIKIPFQKGYFWKQHFAYNSGAFQGVCHIDYQYEMIQDSVIGGIKYQYIVAKEKIYDNPGACISVSSFQPPFNALLRQDTAKKLVIQLCPDGKERILYNFNKKVNDTIHVYYDYASPASAVTLTISAIDSVWLNDGVYHKRFHIGLDHVIEGVGSTLGLLTPYWRGADGENRLGCMGLKSPQKIVFGSNCVPMTAQEHDFSKSRLTLFPNPVSERLLIQGGELTHFDIEIQTIQGVIIHQMRCNGQCNMDVSDLPSGTYIVKQTNQGHTVASLFIKK